MTDCFTTRPRPREAFVFGAVTRPRGCMHWGLARFGLRFIAERGRERGREREREREREAL